MISSLEDIENNHQVGYRCSLDRTERRLTPVLATCQQVRAITRRKMSTDKTREKAQLFDYLNKQGINDLTTINHPEAPTCDEWLQHLENNPEKNDISLDNSFLIKNLLLRDHKKKRFVFLLVSITT